MLATISSQICTIRACLGTIPSSRCTRRRLAHRRAPRRAAVAASSQPRRPSRAKKPSAPAATSCSRSSVRRTCTCRNRPQSSTSQPRESNLASSESSMGRTDWRCRRRRLPSGKTQPVSANDTSMISDLIFSFSLAITDRVPGRQDDPLRRQVCPVPLS